MSVYICSKCGHVQTVKEVDRLKHIIPPGAIEEYKEKCKKGFSTGRPSLVAEAKMLIGTRMIFQYGRAYVVENKERIAAEIAAAHDEVLEWNKARIQDALEHLQENITQIKESVNDNPDSDNKSTCKNKPDLETVQNSDVPDSCGDNTGKEFPDAPESLETSALPRRNSR